MSRSRISGRSVPRLPWRVFRLLPLFLPLLLGCATGTPSAGPRAEANGFTFSGEIREGDPHVYPVELRAGQFLRITVQEDGLDLAIHLLDPGGNLVAKADSENFGSVPNVEDLAALAEIPGSHRIQIAALGEGIQAFTLRVEGPRAPTETDKRRNEAARATWEGLFREQSSMEERISSLERADGLWRELGDLEKAAEISFLVGFMRFKLQSPYREALSSFEKAAELAARLTGQRSKCIQAEALAYVGRCLRHLERRQESREVHGKSLALARELGETGLQAENLNLLGLMEIEDGEPRRGIELLLQALELTRQAEDWKKKSQVLNHLAYAYERLGEMQKALAMYQQALELALKNQDPEHQQVYLNNLGDTYRILGDWEEAFDRYQRSIALSATAKKPETDGLVLINLADAYFHLGRSEEARKSLDRALALGRQIHSREVQTFALGNLALFLLQSKQPAEALEQARQAVELAASLEEQTFSRYVLGRALGDMGDLDQARSELSTALELARRRGSKGAQAEIDLTLARIERDGGALGSALSRIDEAITLIEKRRERVISPELRTSFLASKQDYYELKVDILMSLHEQRPTEGFAADALQVSEQARARSLLDTLNESRAEIRLGVDPALLTREREAREDVNARDSFRRELLAQASDPEKVREAEHKLDEALAALDKVQVQLRQESPHYAALTQPEPLNLGEIQSQILTGDVLLLEYSLGTSRSFLWAVGSNSVASFELPGRALIEGATLRWYRLLTTRNDRQPGESVADWKKRFAEADAAAEEAGRELARMVLQPAEALLRRRTLLFVADGALHYVPFAALPLPSTGDPLVLDHEVVNLPSASVLGVLRRELSDRQPAPRALAIIADPVFQKNDERLLGSPAEPDVGQLSQAPPAQRGSRLEESRAKGIDLSRLPRLKYSGKEAEVIASLAPSSEVFKAVGFDASRTTVLSGSLDGYRNVHFATHGVLSSEHAELSGLVLSLFDQRGDRQEGLLRLNDIYNLRLDADLVVLSACQTALGPEIRGEGLIGLTRGFMYAGAPRVLATLWSVDDQPTADLMVSFYRGMLRDGLSPAAALRKAQLEMRQRPRLKSPYFWAGFSLQGEWR